MLADAPQAKQSAQPPEHGPEAGRRALILDQGLEPSEAGVLDVGQGQGAAVVGLHPHTHTESACLVVLTSSRPP